MVPTLDTGPPAVGTLRRAELLHSPGDECVIPGKPSRSKGPEHLSQRVCGPHFRREAGKGIESARNVRGRGPIDERRCGGDQHCCLHRLVCWPPARSLGAQVF